MITPILSALAIAMLNPSAIASHATVKVRPMAQAVTPTETEIHRPTVFPDRIVLTWDADPATTQAVTWRTSPEVNQGLVQFGVAEDGPGFEARMQSLTATSESFASDLGPARYHSARMTGLKPASRYQYRVGDGTHWSEWIQFRTASDRAEPFDFVYLGDAQNDIRSQWSRLVREAYLTAPQARFFVHAGDLINRANRDAEWGEWHRAPGWMNGMVPVVVTPGNHEYEKNPAGEGVISGHWQPQFTLPRNGIPNLPESNYYLDYQSVRIISLNSNEQIEPQAVWLDSLLKRTTQPWVVVTFHHPVFSAAKGRDNAAIRSAWKPILDRYRVDLVLQGHDHTYARSNGKTGASGAVDGTMYVVSVSGPKMYNLEREDWMQRAAEDTQLFQVIRIDGNRLIYTARTTTGTLYDQFELRKRSGRMNQIIEGRPRMPERLRPVVPAPAAVPAK